MISVIDMPPSDESIWWRGKRGFEVGFFPSDCVEVIGDKVPAGLNLPGGSVAGGNRPGHLNGCRNNGANASSGGSSGK